MKIEYFIITIFFREEQRTKKKAAGGEGEEYKDTEIQREKADFLGTLFRKRSSSITLLLLFRDTFSLQAEKHKNK